MRVRLRWIVLLATVSLLAGACGAPAATATPAPEPTATEAAQAAQPLTVRWFVGLGTGGNPEQVEAQEAVVEAFNAGQSEIRLELEIVQNDVAYDTLKTQIASGNPPDLVGPVGIRGANEFSGLFLDLEPLVKSTGYDLSEFNPAQVDFYRIPGEGLVGLPFGVFPSMIYYNRDLFDEAGLDYPPHEFGAAYADGDPWDIAKLEELALLLTVDAKGNDATSADFDLESVVQFGYLTQWTDPRGQATLFGSGNFVDEDGNAVLPDRWRDAFHWYYAAMHETSFMPDATYQQSDLLAAGNPFNSGNLAMAHVHLWYTCCLGDVANWDIAAVPAYNGSITAKLHADTFRILKATKSPEAAFEVLGYLVGDAAPQLLQAYGAMPARERQQEEFFAGLEEKYPHGVDWQVAVESLSYPDNPSHEANIPNFAKADDRIKAFQSLYESEAGLDLDAELDKLVAQLQAIFDEAR